MRRMLAAMTALMLGIDGPAAVAGGYGYSGYSYGGYYQQPTYYPTYQNYYNYYQVQPVVVQSNLVPAFVFQGAPALAQPPVTTSTTVTTNRTTATTTTTAAQASTATASTAGVAVGQSSGAQAASVSAAAIEKLIDARIAARLESYVQAGSQAQQLGPPVLQDTATETQTSDGSDQSSERIVEALKVSCLPCHSAASHKGNVTLFDASGAFSPSVDAGTIFDAVKGDQPRMPKGRPPMAPDVVEAIGRLAGDSR